MTDAEIIRFYSHVDIKSKNECWLWKAGKYPNGYGKAYVNGKAKLAHRVAWTMANGREPRKGYEVAHAPIICHNRACCNPNHLSEKTRSQNQLDRKLDNTHTGRNGSTNAAKITRDDAERIREMCANGTPRKDIAGLFNLTVKYISKIATFKTWKPQANK